MDDKLWEKIEESFYERLVPFVFAFEVILLQAGFLYVIAGQTRRGIIDIIGGICFLYYGWYRAGKALNPSRAYRRMLFAMSGYASGFLGLDLLSKPEPVGWWKFLPSLGPWTGILALLWGVIALLEAVFGRMGAPRLTEQNKLEWK